MPTFILIDDTMVNAAMIEAISGVGDTDIEFLMRDNTCYTARYNDTDTRNQALVSVAKQLVQIDMGACKIPDSESLDLAETL